MWAYEKKLQYPVKIKNPNANYAKIIISQLGGPSGKNRQFPHERKLSVHIYYITSMLKMQYFVCKNNAGRAAKLRPSLGVILFLLCKRRVIAPKFPLNY